MLCQQPGLKVVQQYGHMGNYIMFTVSNNMVILYCYRVVKNMIWFCMASVQHLSLTITVDRWSKSFGLTNDLVAATALESSRLPATPDAASHSARKQVICFGKCAVSSGVVITIAATVTTQACTRRVNGLVVMVKLIWFCATLPGHHSDGSSICIGKCDMTSVCTALLCQRLMVAQQQYVPNMAVKTSQQFLAHNTSLHCDYYLLLPGQMHHPHTTYSRTNDTAAPVRVAKLTS